MALDLFAVAAPGQARCRRPDARGLRDLARLGMRVAMKLGDSSIEARLDQEAFEGALVHVTEPLASPGATYPVKDQGCPACLVGTPGVCADPQLECPTCRGTGAPVDRPAGVDHGLVTRLVRELIGHGASRRPAVIYCADGAVRTGLVCGALRLALGHPVDEVLEEYAEFCDLAKLSTGMIPWSGSPEAAAGLSPGRFRDLAVDYLQAIAAARG